MTVAELLADYDWRAAVCEAFIGDQIDCNSAQPQNAERVEMSGIVEVVTADAGENNGADWIAIFKMDDGRFMFMSAWCDYTGWDCRAGGRLWVANDLPTLVRYGIGDEWRRRLGYELND